MELNSSGQNNILSLLVEGISDESAGSHPVQSAQSGEFPKLLEIASQSTSRKISLQDDGAVSSHPFQYQAPAQDHQVAVFHNSDHAGIESPIIASPTTEGELPNLGLEPALDHGLAPRKLKAIAAQSPIIAPELDQSSILENQQDSSDPSESIAPILSNKPSVVQDSKLTEGFKADDAETSGLTGLALTPTPPAVLVQQFSHAPASPRSEVAVPMSTNNDVRIATGQIDQKLLHQSDLPNQNIIGGKSFSSTLTPQISAEAPIPQSFRGFAQAQPTEAPINTGTTVKEREIATDLLSRLSATPMPGRSDAVPASLQTTLESPQVQSPVSLLSPSAFTGEVNSSLGFITKNIDMPSENLSQATSYLNAEAVSNSGRDNVLGALGQELKPLQRANSTLATAQQHIVLDEELPSNISVPVSTTHSKVMAENRVGGDLTKLARSGVVKANIKDNLLLNQEVQQTGVRADIFSPATLSTVQPTDVFRSDKTTSPVANLPLISEVTELPAKLGQQIRFMAENGVQSVVMRVNPAELGPVRIEVAMDIEQLSVNITATQTLAREMLESAIPRLRDTLALQNEEHVEVNVSQQNREGGQLPADQQPQHRQNYYSQTGENVLEPDGETINPEAVVELSSNGRIDAYV